MIAYFIDLESQEEVIRTAEKSPFVTVFEYGEFCSMSADYALSSKNVQAFMKRSDLKFDLIINEEFFHDSFLMFAHKYNAPIVTISTQILIDMLSLIIVIISLIFYLGRYVWHIGFFRCTNGIVYTTFACSTFDACLQRQYVFL